jgi:hypothetical protein
MKSFTRICALLLGLLPVFATAQTPYFVGVPRADGSLHDQCMRSIVLAKQVGATGIAVQCGPSYDPANPAIPLGQVKDMADLALSLGLHINASFECPSVNDFWSPKNGGIRWLTPTRPPAGPGNAVWLTMGKDRSAYCKVLADEAVAHGLNPADCEDIEGWNEVGKGGISEPKELDGTFEPQYAVLRDGEIEGNWLIFANYVEGHTDYAGIPNYGLTFEGASGPSQQLEITSFVLHGGSTTAKQLTSRWTASPRCKPRST